MSNDTFRKIMGFIGIMLLFFICFYAGHKATLNNYFKDPQALSLIDEEMKTCNAKWYNSCTITTQEISRITFYSIHPMEAVAQDD